jgi:hypothetical protein
MHINPRPQWSLGKLDWRTGAAALAALGIVAGGVATAQYLRSQPGGGTAVTRVANQGAVGYVNGPDVTPRIFTPGGDQPSTSLPGVTAHIIPRGSQVDLMCYIKGQPVAGPDALGATDPFWDVTGDLGFSLKAGEVAVVADAFIHTDRPVDQMIPACDANGNPPGQNQQGQQAGQSQAGQANQQPAAKPGTGGCGSDASANGFTASACISANGILLVPDAYVTVPADGTGGCQVVVSAFYTSGQLAVSDSFDCKPGKNHYVQGGVSQQTGTVADWLVNQGVRAAVSVTVNDAKMVSADSPVLGDPGTHDNAATKGDTGPAPSSADHRINLACSAPTPTGAPVLTPEWVTILFPVSVSPSGLVTQADTSFTASIKGAGAAFTVQSVTGTAQPVNGGRAVQVHGQANLLLGAPGPLNGAVEAALTPVSCDAYFTQPFTNMN